MSGHRKAPLPDSMKRPAVRGMCRWCGLPVLNGKQQSTKRTWHPACVAAFKLIHWPAETRRVVFERDKGVCARCRKDTMAEKREREGHWWKGGMPNGTGRLWQHDHIRPLLEANGDLSFWSLDNIQTLCTPCHIEKGKEDNARRREARQQMEPKLL